jgi:hypothetical protein
MDRAAYTSPRWSKIGDPTAAKPTTTSSLLIDTPSRRTRRSTRNGSPGSTIVRWGAGARPPAVYSSQKFFRFGGEERLGTTAEVERQRGPHPDGHGPHRLALDPLDAQRFPVPPDEEEHRVPRLLVDPLHHGQGALADVEAGEDGGAEPEQADAEAPRAATPAGSTSLSRPMLESSR